ncbi:CAP domain-containing protein [Aquibacillus albus]|uniref:Uncharacterized protein YkwD n=1 Tax=Aquibacillus albus TaxID=1168171 RepID=A0ABS2N298_9BACI|nr:CAP domain-containing protein [Aquibacillus albus]MBM7572257.1 uncharacterized protein YkwD [Aquibacillus albus]
MRGIRYLFILSLIAGGIIYIIQEKLEPNHLLSNVDLKLRELSFESKESYIDLNTSTEGELFYWVDKSVHELEKQFGLPNRKDLSSYGYEWWVYTDDPNRHIQFGVKNNQVVTIFATGDVLPIHPIEIGQPYEDIEQVLDIQKEVSFSNGDGSFRFNLSESDLKIRPLIQLEEEVFIQLYFDTFLNSLSSIRILRPEVLLAQRPYEIFYRGSLPEERVLTENEWTKVEGGMEQQIFDITNVIRSRYEKATLDWDDAVATVAFGHSKDMSEKNYFSHYSPNGEGLKERLINGEINYLSAGENIAAQYTDGPAAVEGWLNSEGHRDALLKGEYTHLGVGVYRYYYTQNFLQKHMEE